jgi:hypothetical protein
MIATSNSGYFVFARTQSVSCHLISQTLLGAIYEPTYIEDRIETFHIRHYCHRYAIYTQKSGTGNGGMKSKGGQYTGPL